MPEILRYAGFAEEENFNPDTAPSAKYHVDIASAGLDAPTESQMIYEGGLGRAARTHRPGFYAPTGNVVYAFDIYTIAFLLKWALGGYAFTGEHAKGAEIKADNEQIAFSASEPENKIMLADGEWDIIPEEGTKIEVSGSGDNDGTYTVVSANSTEIEVEEDLTDEDAGQSVTIEQWLNLHEAWGNNDVILPSFTTRLGKDVFEHVFKGCVINSLQIEVEGEYCMATADIVAAEDAKDTIKDPGDLILPKQYPLAFHETTAKIKGSDKSCEVKSLTIEINNNANAENGRGLGQRHPCRIPVQERQLTVSKELWFENTDALERYWGGSSGPAKLGSEEFDLELEFDSGVHGKLTIKLPRFIYTEVPQQPSGRDEITQSTSGRALIDTVEKEDGSEVDTEVYAALENVGGEIGNGD